MDYKKIYNDLIESRLKLNRSKKEKDCFYEKHHIIPKCLGGSNTKNNLILLTPREHYIAHLLLTQMYEGKEKAKMCYALIMMCCVNNSQKRIVSSKQYELAKKLVSENCKGENASFYGRKWSEEEKIEISNRMKYFRFQKGNIPWNKGVQCSEETKRKISETSKGRKGNIVSDEHKKIISETMKGVSKTDEHKKKLSDINKGKKLSEETKKKMSDSRKNIPQEKIECPYCNKIGGTTMYRWHFNNCKFK